MTGSNRPHEIKSLGPKAFVFLAGYRVSRWKHAEKKTHKGEEGVHSETTDLAKAGKGWEGEGAHRAGLRYRSSSKGPWAKRGAPAGSHSHST